MDKVKFAVGTFDIELDLLRIAGKKGKNKVNDKGNPVFHIRYLWMNAKMLNNLANEILKYWLLPYSP
jgi:hypothetical protein